MHENAKKSDDDNNCSDGDDAEKKRKTEKKLILALAGNTIQHRRGPRKTCKISSLKIPASACHV